MKKILNDKILLAGFISNLFYCIAFPTIQSFVIKSIGQKYISANMMACCLSGIVFPSLWNKYSDVLYKKYHIFCRMETLLYILLCVSIIFSFIDVRVYYIIDTILFCVLSKNIGCGITMMKSLRYSDKERAEFDNNMSLASNASSLIGFGLSLVLTINLNLAFIIFAFGMIIDNFFYISAWKEEKNKRSE